MVTANTFAAVAAAICWLSIATSERADCTVAASTKSADDEPVNVIWYVTRIAGANRLAGSRRRNTAIESFT